MDTVKFFAVNISGRQRLPVQTLKEALQYVNASPYWRSYPPKRIEVERKEVVWQP